MGTRLDVDDALLVDDGALAVGVDLEFDVDALAALHLPLLEVSTRYTKKSSAKKNNHNNNNNSE